MRKQNVPTGADEDPHTTFINQSESESRLAVIIAVISFILLLICFSK
jgi:hypothetical protein